MRRPRTAGELMQFLQSVNWLRAFLPRLAKTLEPLRELLEEHLRGNVRRSKRAASNRIIDDSAWTFRRGQAWHAAQDLVAHAVTLSHPKEGYEPLMFLHASDLHRGSFLTQVPAAELDGPLAVEDMSHEPMGFQRGTFREPHVLRWIRKATPL